jgi:membrane-bound lytic murein transglycosylase D
MRRVLLRVLAPIALIAVGACQAPLRPVPPDDTPAPPAKTAPAPAAPATEPAPVFAPPAPAPIPAPVELSAGTIFDRLVTRFADPPCIEDRVVQRWERTYGRWPPRLRSQLEAVLPLMAMVLDELETHHLPAEFALLPIVESWYRPDAGSPRTAYGLWQFTTGTARNQGLRIVPGYDERLAPQAATRAAMRYLATLQNRFGDWRLANMAFNAGEYRVLRALARHPMREQRPSAASHLPTGLSMTTYEHLAKVQALACLIARPERFGLELPRATIVPRLHVAALPPEVTSLDRHAAAAGLPADELRRLNPAFLGGQVVAAARREILLPGSAAAPLATTDATAPSQAVTPPAARKAAEYHVRSGDTLGAIARRHRVRLAELLRWNRLDVRSVIHPGQKLRLEP